MIQLLLGLAYGFQDVLRAVVELVLRRPRSRYVAAGVVRAPLAAVWDLVMRRDVTYAATATRLWLEPVEDQDGVFLVRVRQGERDLPGIALRYEETTAPTMVRVRYLKALSPPGAAVGSDDVATIRLTAEADDSTRVEIVRDMAHSTFATRISGPISARNAIALTKSQAEIEAGIQPDRAPLWHQLVWTGLAFLSFAWLLDWRLAVAVMGIIAIHELGHALFMLRYGLGINVVSFVPFLGGVAAPKRYYQTEWQRGIVALMGVGVSLPLTFAAIWVAEATVSPNLAAIAILSVIINAVNLVPFPALDGSVPVSMLLGKLHRTLNLAVSILMFGLFVAVGIVMNHPLVWTAIALSFISVVQVMSLKMDDHLEKMGVAASLAMLALYLALIAGHVAAFHWATMTTASTENRLLSECMRANQNGTDGIKACRDQNRLWLLPDH